MNFGMRKIEGDEAKLHLREQIIKQSNDLCDALAPFDAQSTLENLLETYKAVEELINLVTDPSLDTLHRDIISSIDIPELDRSHLQDVFVILLRRFGHEITVRFIDIVLQSHLAFRRFHMSGISFSQGLLTVAHAIGYLHTRRRHLVTAIYCVPKLCKGSDKFDQHKTLETFLPIIEQHGALLKDLFDDLMLADVFPDFCLHVNDYGHLSSHHYNPLNSLGLDTERVNILEVIEQNDALEPYELEKLDPKLIFSKAELRNQLVGFESAFAEFNLAGTAFGPVSKFIRSCIPFCHDEYTVKMEQSEFENLFANSALPESMRDRLVSNKSSYGENLDEFAPFIACGAYYYSTVNLLMRFANNWKSVCLNKIRRFQIRSGFIFEGCVKDELVKQGFTVTNTKRVEGKEFDVVAILGDTIYNIQCKNNFLDMDKVASQPRQFARYNNRLNKYYAKALLKEEGREQLLKNKFGLPNIKHVVLSKFHLATTNPRVLSFSQIESFRERFVSETA